MSPVLEDHGSYYKAYPFEGTAGEALTIALSSDGFDAYLIVVNPAGEEIAQATLSGPMLYKVVPRGMAQSTLALRQ